MDDPQIYTDEQLVDDLATLIAQGVSGIVGAKPESEDVTLAKAFAEIINNNSLMRMVLLPYMLQEVNTSSERL